MAASPNECRLDEAVEVRAHGEWAVRNERDDVEQPARRLLRHALAAPSAASIVTVHSGSGLRVGVARWRRLDRRPKRSPGRAEPRRRSRRARDGVTALPADQCDEPKRRGRMASRNTRPSTLIAFAWPRAIWTPEWPPSPSPATTDKVVTSGNDTARGASTWIHGVLADGQDAVLLAVEVDQGRPVSSDPSSAFAPSSPTSSATVISSSSGP